MPKRRPLGLSAYRRFSTLQCGSWIDAAVDATTGTAVLSFSTLQCGSWIDAPQRERQKTESALVSVPFNAGRGLMLCFPATPIENMPEFQYPSMRVVD